MKNETAVVLRIFRGGGYLRRSVLQGMLLFFLGLYGPTFGGSARTQVFKLNPGWNAVYLSVEPVDIDPSVVFSNSPVDIAAVYDGIFSPRQFSSDPSADLLSQLGWGVWYSPSRSDWFLGELSAVHGQKPYLLHAKTACTLEIEGEVEVPQIRWQPNAYNLVGFCLDAAAPPTFAQFFGGSKAHADCNAYRLVDGTWQRMLDPENTAMRSGEAFWIYCDGRSDFQGPLQVETNRGLQINLSNTGSEIVLRNAATHPLDAELIHATPDGSGLPLAVVVEMVGEEVGVQSLKIPMTNDTWTITVPTLEANATLRIPLALVPERMTEAEGDSLLCIKTDLGTETWLPVHGTREDLK